MKTETIAGKNRGWSVAPATGEQGRCRGASEIFGSFNFPLKRHSSPHGQVTAVSMMKDEGPYLIEWVAHHLAVGFTDLVVYTNDCSDGTDDMLIRLEELGLAHHRRNVIPEGQRPQPSALNHAEIEPVVVQSDWVMVFDADEFLSIKYGDGRLDGLIGAARAQGANGIVVTWRIFGSGGVVEWSRAPVSEQYLMAAPESWNKGWGVKTLFTYDHEYWKLGIHRPKMKNRHIQTDFPDSVKWLTGSGEVMEDYFKFRGWRSITRTVGYDWVQLNHYAVKSVDSYAIRKMRGNVNNKADKYNSDYWSLQDRNEVRDETMMRYSAERGRIMLQLLEDPVLSRLHHAAIARAEARLEEIRPTEAYAGLVADLARASEVPITQIVAKPPQPRDKEKIAALMSEVEKHRNDRAKAERKTLPREAPTGVLMGSYIGGEIVPEIALAVEWVANHGVMLPLDPRIFPPRILAAIKDAKFERALARRMPQIIARDARVLEIGAAVGFLAVHLAQTRPDLTVIMQEDNAGLRHVLAQVCERSGRSFGRRFYVSEGVIGEDPCSALQHLLLAERPDALLLADPRLSPQVLPQFFAEMLLPVPRQVLLYGRLLEKWHDGMDEIEAALARRGYRPAPGFEPKTARFFTV